jgi:hypothetical protein
MREIMAGQKSLSTKLQDFGREAGHSNFTGLPSGVNRGLRAGRDDRAMAPIVSTLLSAVGAVRSTPRAEDCLVCRRAVKTGDARMRLPGGGFVHRGCSTYRMRQAERTRRTLGSI